MPGPHFKKSHFPHFHRDVYDRGKPPASTILTHGRASFLPCFCQRGSAAPLAFGGLRPAYFMSSDHPGLVGLSCQTFIPGAELKQFGILMVPARGALKMFELSELKGCSS